MVLDLALYWSRFADNNSLVTEMQQNAPKARDQGMICPAHGSMIMEPSRLISVMNEALLEQPESAVARN